MISGYSVRVRVHLPGVSYKTTITVIKRAHSARDPQVTRVSRRVKKFGQNFGQQKPVRP